MTIRSIVDSLARACKQPNRTAFILFTGIAVIAAGGLTIRYRADIFAQGTAAARSVSVNVHAASAATPLPAALMTAKIARAEEKSSSTAAASLLPPASALPSAAETAAAKKKQASTGAKTGRGYYILPAAGKNWGAVHSRNGVDIANACGTPVNAAAAGVVTELGGGWNGGYGKSVTVKHANGTKTLYAHLQSIKVSIGTSLEQGEYLGDMGDTGQSTGCHLHFEVHGAKNPFAWK